MLIVAINLFKLSYYVNSIHRLTNLGLSYLSFEKPDPELTWL